MKILFSVLFSLRCVALPTMTLDIISIEEIDGFG